MIDKIKSKIIDYKYQIGGTISLVIISAIYHYYKSLKKEEDVSKDENQTDIQYEIKNELNLIKKKLTQTEKQLTKYKDELKNKKELSLYENSQYKFDRMNKKILFLKWSATSSNTTVINEELHEPFTVDKLSDIYLDNFTTSYTGSYLDFSNQPNKSSYVLKIDEFNIQSNSNDSTIFNTIIIPNDYSTTPTNTTSRKTHKGKKLNYICSINPCTISKLTGTITDLNNSNMFSAAGDTFIAEFIFIARDK